METTTLDFIKEFYQSLEKGIAQLDDAQRQQLYRPCAHNCVHKYVMGELKRQFNECNCNLDEQFTRYGKSPYFFAEIKEPGHVYEIGYPVAQCLCPVVSEGFATSALHCECSRQSFVCVFNELLPNNKVSVVTLQTLLDGGTQCRFKITVE